MKIILPALSVNEAAARAVTGAFCAQLDPTISELADIKCSVSEAVTNCIVHAYAKKSGMIYITVKLYNDRSLKIDIRDTGCGIPDIEKAREPLFTTDTDGERSGMGFSVMESFMDSLSVVSKVGRGTRVTLKKKLSSDKKLRK